jgi:hypothetical protein
MSRINWMSIATGAVLVVSLLFAFLYGWYQWGNRSRANQNQDAVRRQIGMVEQELRIKQGVYKPIVGALAAPDEQDEDAAFVRNLLVLINASGVKQVQIDRARIEPLPTIGRTTASGTPGAPANNANTAPNDPNAPPELSITNLPLGVRAISTNLAVQGTFSSIRLFLYQIQSLRYRARAVNINSMQISMADDKGNLRAAMVLTRFVRPDKDEPRPIGAADPNNPLSNRQTSPATQMARPDAQSSTNP